MAEDLAREAEILAADMKLERMNNETM